MPHCVVPQCKNNEHTENKWYSIPANPKVRSKYITLIRRKGYHWKPNDRICGWHFPDGKSKGTLPSRFQWNEDKYFGTPDPPKSQLNATRSRIRKPHERGSHHDDNRSDVRKGPSEELNVVDSNNLTPVSTRVDEMVVEFRIKRRRKSPVLTKAEMTDKALIDVLLERISELQDTLKRFHKELEMDRKHFAAKEQEYLTREMQIKNDLEGAKKEIIALKIKNEKLASQSEKNPLLQIANLRHWNPRLLVSWTGLQSYESILVLIAMVESKIQRCVNGRPPTPVGNRVLVCLVKLKTDLSFSAIGLVFGMSRNLAAKCFRTMVATIYDAFYEGVGPLSRIPSRHKCAQLLPEAFVTLPNCRMVIDCTEFQTVVPPKMTDKKLIYSHYKSKYTMKILIGCAPHGTVTFVSELFVGSESDKSIVSKSGLLEKLDPGDMLLADKGFLLYDIMPPGIDINIPSFLDRPQFTVNEIKTNKIIARARVIIERLNARFKVFRILDCVKGCNKRDATKIVKVCVALTTLMPTLIKESSGDVDNDADAVLQQEEHELNSVCYELWNDLEVEVVENELI